MKPTIGRVVHYISYGTPNGEYKPEHRAAIITRVSETNENQVDICVFNPKGIFFNENVNFGTREGQVHWPERDEDGDNGAETQDSSPTEV